MKSTLSHKLIATNAALIACLLVVGGASVVGLLSLRVTIEEMAEEYEESRLVDEVIRHATTARAMLEQGEPAGAAVVAPLDEALRRLDSFAAFQEVEGEALELHQNVESSLESRIRGAIIAARTLAERTDPAEASSRERITAQLDLALRDLGALLEQTDVSGVRKESDQHAARTALMVAALTLLIIAGAILMSVFGYRSVIVPLRQLREGVRDFAGGDLGRRLDTTVDQEFAALADEFNRMAGELEALYRDLEAKVQAKSRELVRSERLASVGFLAAGVAHEINNPLSIMTGYAEMGQKWLHGAQSDEQRAELRTALQIIRQEAFRCKQIIQQLLSLSKMGDGVRGEVSLPRVADDVIGMLSAMRKYRGRAIALRCPDQGLPAVWGNEPELKQVVLNLAVNALEALDQTTDGSVVIELARRDSAVQLEVSDNGAGMTPEVLERVFEPFFTQRGGAEGRGTGLGLSICHAIIESHGGTIRASSDGPSRGSRFTIALPAVQSKVTHVE